MDVDKATKGQKKADAGAGIKPTIRERDHGANHEAHHGHAPTKSNKTIGNSARRRNMNSSKISLGFGCSKHT